MGTAPVAVTDRLAVAPGLTATLAGWTVMATGVLTTRVAAVLVPVPTMLVTHTS